MKKIRCFLAADLADELAAAVAPVISQLALITDSVKWVAAEDLHLTLKFFGEIDELETYEVAKAVTQVVGGLPEFEICLSGIAAFPAVDRPRTIWAGVTDGSDTLLDVQAQIDESLQRLGFPRERRQFHPHLTLGRVRHKSQQEELSAALRELAGYECGRAQIGELVLFRSELFRTGPQYTVLATCPFEG